jgi:hypothetical protein
VVVGWLAGPVTIMLCWLLLLLLLSLLVAHVGLRGCWQVQAGAHEAGAAAAGKSAAHGRLVHLHIATGGIMQEAAHCVQ